MDILYEDARIVVAAKPAGVLSTDEPGVFFEDIHFVDTLLTLSYRISRQ